MPLYEPGGAASVTAETAARIAADALLLAKADNLASLGSASTARTSLGLGSSATHPTTDYDAAGAATAAQAAAVQRANHTGTQLLATISDAGTAASHAHTDYDPAGTAAALPTHTSGTLANLPGNGATVNGSTYFATDQNGGTLYQQVAGVQTAVSPGASAGDGLTAGPVYLSAQYNIQATANTMTDVTGMSIAVPASSKNVLLRFKCEVGANGGTATSGTVLSAYIALSDNSNVNKVLSIASFVSTGASAVQYRDVVVELWLAAPVSAATYKVRAQTSAAIPTNWTSMVILPAGGLVSGAKDALTAIAY